MLEITTGNIEGNVEDNTISPLPGVVITAVRKPTGTKYSIVTMENGCLIIGQRQGFRLYQHRA